MDFNNYNYMAITKIITQQEFERNYEIMLKYELLHNDIKKLSKLMSRLNVNISLDTLLTKPQKIQKLPLTGLNLNKINVLLHSIDQDIKILESVDADRFNFSRYLTYIN
jgi:hypothetical protein